MNSTVFCIKPTYRVSSGNLPTWSSVSASPRAKVAIQDGEMPVRIPLGAQGTVAQRQSIVNASHETMSIRPKSDAYRSERRPARAGDRSPLVDHACDGRQHRTELFSIVHQQ
jgi:hypothetical protein